MAAPSTYEAAATAELGDEFVETIEWGLATTETAEEGKEAGGGGAEYWRRGEAEGAAAGEEGGADLGQAFRPLS